MEDYLRSLGYTALASRMKRLSELMIAEVNHCYAVLGITFDANTYPIFALLRAQPKITLTDAASKLGINHAAISQKAAQLSKRGLIKVSPCTEDKRSKLLSLTKEGKERLRICAPFWEAAEHTAQELVQQAPAHFLTALDSMDETVLSGQFRESLLRHYKARQLERVRILPFSPALAPHFDSLNRWWVEKYFSVEPIDDTYLRNPKKHIIDKGGDVFFAELDGEILGACALIKSDNTFEMSKLGVREDAHGKQIGKKLVEYAIERAQALGADMLWMLTNSKLTAAQQLYRSSGFQCVPILEADLKRYQRCDTRFELPLAPTRKKAA